MKGRPIGFFVAALVLRGFYLWLDALRLPFLKQPILDAAFFEAAARRIATTGWPAGPFEMAPGYPAFLAGLQRLLGPGPIGVAVVQALLGAATVALGVALAERLFDRRAAWLTGFLLLGTAALPFQESKLLPGALATLLTLVFVTLAVAARGAHRGGAERRALDRARADGARPDRPKAREMGLASAAGLAGGLATLVHPALGLAVLAVAAGAALEAARGYRAWRPALLMLLAFGLALLPAGLLNLSRGALAPVSTDGGFNAWLAVTQPPEDGAIAPNSPVRLTRRAALADSLELTDRGEILPPGKASGYWSTRAIQAFGQDPAAGLSRMGGRLGRVFVRRDPTSNGSLRLEMQKIPFLAAAALPFSLLSLIGLVGLAMAAGRFGAPRGSSWTLAPAAWTAAAVGLGIAFSPDDGSARNLLAPLGAIFVAHALQRLDGAWQSGRRGEAAAAVLLGGLLLASTWRALPGGTDPARHDAALFVEAGLGFAASGQAAEATANWHEALRIDPEAVEAAIRLGQQALAQRDLGTAIEWYERAARLRPRRFDVRNNLGILYYQAQRAEDVVREMAAAQQLRPADPGPWFYLGISAQKTGDLVQADSMLAGAIERDPRFAGAWIRRIEVSLSRNEPALARTLADSAGARGIALPAELARRLR